VDLSRGARVRSRQHEANGYIMATARTTSNRPAEALPTSWQRLLALSGIAFAVLFVVGFLISGSDAPDYSAADQVWTNWADDNEVKGRIGALLTPISMQLLRPWVS
jgi:hypothetical protein